MRLIAIAGHGVGGLVLQWGSTIKWPCVCTVTSWYPSWYDLCCCQDIKQQQTNNRNSLIHPHIHEHTCRFQVRRSALLGQGKDWLVQSLDNEIEWDARSRCWLHGILMGQHYKVVMHGHCHKFVPKTLDIARTEISNNQPHRHLHMHTSDTHCKTVESCTPSTYTR